MGNSACLCAYTMLPLPTVDLNQIPGCTELNLHGDDPPVPHRAPGHLRDHHLRHHRPRDVHGRDAPRLLHQRHGQTSRA